MTLESLWLMLMDDGNLTRLFPARVRVWPVSKNETRVVWAANYSDIACVAFHNHLNKPVTMPSFGMPMYVKQSHKMKQISQQSMHVYPSGCCNFTWSLRAA